MNAMTARPKRRPRSAAKVAPIARLLAVTARLRGKRGCPWDREQTLRSLKPYLIEEAYEALDAIDSGDSSKHMEELGDVLLQVVLQSQINKETGAFNFNDVVRTLTAKLIHRHPHVFGSTRVKNSKEVLRNWEKLKAREKKPGDDQSILAGLPRHLPALQRAQRVQNRAARVGFEWERVRDVVAKVDEEVAEVKQALRGGRLSAIEEELGDLLFAVVNLCRFKGLHAEELLDMNVQKFIRRFKAVEARVRASGRAMTDCSLAELDGIWNEIKHAGRGRKKVRARP